ncbi:SIN1-domain-containing protein [Choiromyces venosus 120613-1]|uniref:SIN1-domain-containing protein n=1 Tax=Choiromyces venosus 120613-1 TaxID=1336337 RepID=A0A3N4JQ18_9PEZI|nr:SIN1-domain-containing protein [Choiromyces venosus 120613-1]
MSLLQNQDFVIYRIRTRYLQGMKDGVGERLISVNPASVNIPAYRNAGWGAAAEIRRTYSPPITSGNGAEYFTGASSRSIGLGDGSIGLGDGSIGLGEGDGVIPPVFIDQADDDNLVGLASVGLASHFSNESTDMATEKSEIRRRRRRERQVHREDDDSSDMSDDSDDDEGTQSAQQKIQFDFPKKEIVPPRPRSGSSPLRGPQVLVTSPSKSRTRRLRGGSHGDVDFHKNNQDHLPPADEGLLSSGLVSEIEKLHAEIANKLRSSPNSSLPRDERFGDESADDSDASTSMSSDFNETADSHPAVIGNSLSLPQKRQPASSPAVLHALPPPIRPISQLQPISALTQLLRAKESEAANPFESYKDFSGKGELRPITLKLLIPYTRSSSLFEVNIKQGGSTKKETTVLDAIGFVLYKYIEDKKEPVLTEELSNINKWVFRMVDDGEPDDDFPPLERTQPITSYIVKKGRSGRGSARDAKLEGEFALCEANQLQFLENERVTPTPPTFKKPTAGPPATPSSSKSETAIRPTNQTTTPGGTSRILRIHLSTIDEFAQSVSVCVTTNTNISEVLDQVCRKKHLEKSKYVLRIAGTPSHAFIPLERTVASLGEQDQLDLVLRNIPESPIATLRTPKKSKFLQPAATWTPDMLSSRDYLKYTVWRKASMSFMARHERILAIDGEYVHVMPSDQKTLFENSSKTTSIHISTIIGCKTFRKMPSSFKIVVLRPQRETKLKRYDFEAVNEEQAIELVEELRKAMGRFNGGAEG